MCDYSLHALASRPAKVGETLVTTTFPRTPTRGFAAESEPGVALRSTEAHRHQQLDFALELPAESLRWALRNTLSRRDLGPATVERIPAVD
jgi:hypothetical protein